MSVVKNSRFKTLIILTSFTISLTSLSKHSFAQAYQYELEYAFTLPFALTKYSPHTTTDVSPVGFEYPTSLKYSLNPKLYLSPRHKMGVYFAYDEYQYGYNLGLSNPFRSTFDNSGGTIYCALLKSGLSYEYIIHRSNKIDITTALFLNIGKPLTGGWNDTLESQLYPSNADKISVYKGEDINNDLMFLPAVQLKLIYNISPRTSISLGSSYQHGFKNIITTYTSIEMPNHNRSAIYTASFNGSSFFMHIGVAYKFLETFY